MTREQASLMTDALTTFGADHDLVTAACLQAADELNVIMQARAYGAADYLISNAVAGVEARLRAAAKLAGAIELAEESEAAQ